MILYTDITNILKLEHFTGISRVVTEVILRFIRDETDICLLEYCEPQQAYRIISKEAFMLYFSGMVNDKSYCDSNEFIDIDDLEENSVFFDINSCWHTLPNRSWLLPRLKNKQIRIAVLIYDIIPIRFPQFMADQTLMRFMEFIAAHLRYADDIIVNTQAVADDVSQLLTDLSMPSKPIHVINLGADYSIVKSSNSSVTEKVDPAATELVSKGKFLLTVGTVEPRKNHKVMVEAYENYFSKMGVSLVIVGKTGWQMEELTKRIYSNPKYNNGIYHFSNANDATLNYLYKNAFMVLFASYTEGFGLPTIEAMISGIPVICSDIPVMREVGGEFCDFFPADDSDALGRIVKEYLDDPSLYAEKRRRLTTDYVPPKWSDTAAEMEKLLLTPAVEDGFVHKPVKQIVFLSARPAPFLQTIPFIEEFMSFITEVVVCCPDEMSEYLKENYHGRLKLTTITDDQLLNGRTLPPDHSTRNFFLRCLAMGREEIDDEFIMCDDDYRPLKPLTEEVFFKNGKYRGYYFSDISIWKYQITALFSYDFCHFRTQEFLKKNGYPVLQYSSHQPQIINKIWYQELIATYPDIIYKGYDEWSTYFNYCAVVHRELFQPVKYVTLSWPNIGGECRPYEQSDYLFENFYGDNYNYGRAFNGFSKVFTTKEEILSDNSKKKMLALKYRLIFKNDSEQRERFADEYYAEYNESPDFAVHFNSNINTAPDLGAPCCLALLRTGLNKIKIGISRENNSPANICSAVFNVAVRDSNGIVYIERSQTLTPGITNSGISFKFEPRLMPVIDDREYFMEVSALLLGTPHLVSKRIPITFI